MIVNLNWKRMAEIAGGVLFAALLIWFFFLRSVPELEPAETAAPQTFNQSDVRVDPEGAGAAERDGNAVQERIVSPVSDTKIFKIADGPVAGAAFMQEARPTTTVARFVMQQNGHVLDLPIDSPGSVARAVSNTTIPSIARVAWALQNVGGREVAAAAALQYIDSSTIKTVSLAFPAAATSTTAMRAPVRIQFLPNDVLDVAFSPDGNSVAYLLRTAAGADGYVARHDGTNPRKLFSLPLSQATLGWPSSGTLLAASKPAAGVPGVAFSISASSGAVSPVLYAEGLTATADPDFAYVVYQQTSQQLRTSYAHNTETNLDRLISFDPIPEKCVWSRSSASLMYCAVPLAFVPPDYLNLWHQGTYAAADSLVSYDIITGQTTIVAAPGGPDGGTVSDIAELAVSGDDRYILYVKKGERSLWGVRLVD